MNSPGAVPYAHDVTLDASAYAEVERCDLLVAIIGNRFGTNSIHNESSITQSEIRRAIDQSKPVFVFIERDTLAEFKTWECNKAIPGITFAHANNPRIFEFIASIYALKKNNTIFPFIFASEIVVILREQFSGLFQDMLSRKSSSIAMDLISNLKDLASNLDSIVSAVAKNSTDKDFIIDQVLLGNNPIFSSIKQATTTPYRVYFLNKTELDAWLKARQWVFLDSWWLDDGVFAWEQDRADGYTLNLLVSKDLFDVDGNLKPMRHSDWVDQYLQVERSRRPLPQTRKKTLDDDLTHPLILRRQFSG